MKTKTNSKNGSRFTWSLKSLTIKSAIFGALLFTGIHVSAQAQPPKEEYTPPSWWFGVAGGANFNYFSGTDQNLVVNLTNNPTILGKHDGKGVGPYFALDAEFHKPKSILGFMVQLGFDGKYGSAENVINNDNPNVFPFKTNLNYLTLEPSLRVTPFRNNLYFYAGPRIALLVAKSFNYGPNDVSKDVGKMSNIYYTLQVGAGYDIPMHNKNEKEQYVISPFIAYEPYYNQTLTSISSWKVTNTRVGVIIKFGCGHKTTKQAEVVEPTPVKVVEPEVKFSVYSPKNIPTERRVRETFPIRNYVFFNLGSTEIPDRYELLTKDQVKDFKEDQLEVFKPKKLSGRADRQMTAYYNVLNILGDRMGKNPNATINLVGSSAQGPADAKAMAESVKLYLTSVFGIDPGRITTEGLDKPRLPSLKPGSDKDIDLLKEGDRRVSIESSSPLLLMEFQSGPNAPLKPVEILALQTAPLDSYVSFTVEGEKEAFSSWSLEIKDENGVVQNFGPYTQVKVSIPGKSILGTRPQGDYKVTMIGKTKSGNTVKKEASVHMVLWTPAKDEEGIRYSVIFGFDDSKVIEIYEKYLTEIVTPKIPKNGQVIIHGHTDIIGDEAHNLELSWNRAYEVRNIIESALKAAGRTDVTIDVYAFGEDQNLAPFENNFPEERFYNRTVVIDIIPRK